MRYWWFRLRYWRTFWSISHCPCGDAGCECCVVKDEWLTLKWRGEL